MIVPLFTQFSSPADYIGVVRTTWLPMTTSNPVGLSSSFSILSSGSGAQKMVKERECGVLKEQSEEEGT